MGVYNSYEIERKESFLYQKISDTPGNVVKDIS